MLIAFLVFFSFFAEQQAPPQIPIPPPDPDMGDVRFGTTVTANSTDFEGKIYFLDTGTQWIPNFKKMKPVGTVYTPQIYVPPQKFDEGFPGITDRFEWFGIEYTGKFWVERGGKYLFALISDDGSKLYIDGKEKIDNDGTHAAKGLAGEVKLKPGLHDIRVTYFQGPRDRLALILLVSETAKLDELRVFRMQDFKRPPPSTISR